MDFDIRKRKAWPDDGGVSEVIGNILILMMTVVLFSGIIAFVQQMPVPEQTLKTDFSASISFSGNYRHANLSLTHAGGKVLTTKDVKIIINKDGTNYAYNITSDPNFTGSTWVTGKSWKLQLDGLTSSSVIIVTVVDLKTSSAVWTSQVTGGAIGGPPQILQRYVDSEPSTPTPDAVKENDTFTFFVKVEDPDGDLSSVWIDASGVNITGSNGASRAGTYLNGWWMWAFNKVVNAASVDGSVIIIHASDIAAHEAISSFILDITILPSDTIEKQIPVFSELGSSGLPSWLSFVSGALGHGFGFYSELLDENGTPRGKADTDSPATTFYKDSNVFIRFASLSMSNLFLQNSVTITDTRTGLEFQPDYADAGGNSTASAPFYPYPTGGSAYVFECVFSTMNLPPSSYTVTMDLRNQPGVGQTQQHFQADQMILVKFEGEPDPFMPEVQLFKGGWSTTWGTTKETSYDISSSDAHTAYIAITVQNTLAGTVSVAEIRISDMSGGTELNGVPPAGSMISQIKVLDPTRYNFTIALRLNNADQWLPGTNAYTIYISRLNDSNEGVYSLSKQIWIRGSQGKADFFAGTSGMAAGNGNFNTRYYQYYIQNNNFFTDRVMWQSESTPGSSTDFTVSALGLGDVDGDGDKDLLMGQATSNILFLFENTLNQYGTWQAGSSITRPVLDGYTYPITWIAFGDYTGDGHDDFAYSNSNSQIVLYNVTYGSTGWVFRPPATIKWSGTIAKIALKDMTGDGRADLIVLAGGRIWIYDLKYAYDPVLKQYQDPKTLFKVSVTGATGTKDFDIDDMNRDGHLDIVTTGTSTAYGTAVGVNVNVYGSGSENTVLIDETAAGFNPRMEYGTRTGVVDSTQAVGGQTITFTETTVSNSSRVSGIMRFDPLVNNVADQVLRVRAKIAPGPMSSESFYVLVSTDNDAYNYIGEIRATDFTYYNFTLPSNVMGTQMYVKFTDSLAAEDSNVDSIEIDYCAVITFSPTYTEQSLTTTTTWTSVRAAEVDDPQSTTTWKEVVIAKDGASGINIYQRTSGWAVMAGTMPSTDATFYDDAASRVNDASLYPFSTLAPTLFDAEDINGDGFTDLLVCNYTTVSGQLVSKIGFFMNLYTSGQNWRYFLVKAWAFDPPTGQAKNPYIDIVTAASLTVV